jgi:hypothetical protein
MTQSTPIDWSVFDKWSEDTITCACETQFRSHAKSVFTDGRHSISSRKPCPACGATNGHRRASSDVETMTIGGS